MSIVYVSGIVLSAGNTPISKKTKKNFAFISVYILTKLNDVHTWILIRHTADNNIDVKYLK